MKCACVFSLDDSYLMQFQVFFHSLIASNSIPQEAPVFILHDHSLSDQSIQRLERFLSGYQRTATFMDACPFIPATLPIKESDHVSTATFFRLFIAEILPDDIDQAIYLDVDMLALDSIAQLFNKPVKALLAAVDHCSPANELRLWGERGGTYFQAGVLVIPVKKWREKQLANQFLEIMTTYRARIQLWDQDVLNIALRDRWQRLPVWFNVSQAVQNVLSPSIIEDHAALIHYTGSIKPWNAVRFSPFTAHWLRGYHAVFQKPYNRRALVVRRLRSAVRSRIRRMLQRQR